SSHSIWAMVAACTLDFFFSSRRRHTRFSRDWSSDVYSSDLEPTISTSYEIGTEFRLFNNRFWGDFNFYNRDSKNQIININTTPRSEERRVGKECRSRWSP